MWDFWSNEAQKDYQLYIHFLTPPFAVANPPEAYQLCSREMKTSVMAVEIRSCREIKTS
jgi:hypothetical protein